MDRDEILAKLTDRLKTPGDRAAFAWMAHLASLAHPTLGSLVNAAEAIRSAKSKREAEALLVEWMRQTSDALSSLATLLDEMNAKPDEQQLAAVLSEVLGADLAAEFLRGHLREVGVMMNGVTVEELHRFAAQGLLKLRPTHSGMNLGAGNVCGGHVEDRKRPYGMGNGFVLSLGPEAQAQR